MRFVYQYRTRDNALHCGEIVASDREAAFQSLKAIGIKPAKLEDAPGILNQIVGKGKRWIAIGVLGCVSILLMFRLATRSSIRDEQIQSSPRHQIYGDPAFLSELERNEYASVFLLPGERKLAKFAQPGVIEQFSSQDWREEFAHDLDAALTNKIAFAADDRREVTELKQIVNGMKDELRRYLANGNGTTLSYVRRLVERQEKEWKMYNRAKVELDRETDPQKYERINAGLRAAGLRTIPTPDTPVE